MRFLARSVINAVALWLTTLIVTGVHVESYDPGDTMATVLTFLLVAFTGLVNGIIGNLMPASSRSRSMCSRWACSPWSSTGWLMLAGWVSSLFGFGLIVDGFGGGRVLGAVVLALLSADSIVVRPVTGDNGRRR